MMLSISALNPSYPPPVRVSNLLLFARPPDTTISTGPLALPGACVNDVGLSVGV